MDKSLASKNRSRANPRWLFIREWLIEKTLFLCGVFSILVTILIIYVVVSYSLKFFTLENGQPLPWTAAEGKLSIWQRVTEFLTGTNWSAGFHDAAYGVWALVSATLWIALIAGLISIPIGLATALFLSEYALPRIRTFAKPVLEVLAGIPTVVYGFFAIATITPFLSGIIPELRTYNLISAGIVVGIMIIPMVASLSEDALRAVPRSLRDGAHALGATKFEVSTKVVVPAALSGITASFILAISRAIGETMAVALAAGGRFGFTLDPREGRSPMTGFIVQVAKGDAAYGSTLYYSLFAVAGVLFFMTLTMNIIAQWVTRRFRQVYQ